MSRRRNQRGFGDSVHQLSAEALAICDNTRKAISIELFRSVIEDTPVDTGRARGNWQTTTDNPATGQLDGLDQSGAGAVSLAMHTVDGSGSEQTLYLVNNLPYSVPLEYGSSEQAPHGMVRRNVSRLSSIIRRAIRENRFL